MKMQSVDIHDLGKVIRKVRKEKGLRLEDLADDKISPATISNIERGVPHVRSDRAIYLLNKLGIAPEEIPELLIGEQESLKSLEQQLQLAEVQRDIGRPQTVLDELDHLDIKDENPLAPLLYYIKGKCLVSLKQWKKAERSLHKAIQLATQAKPETNIEAAAFLELSVCHYLQNDLDGALKFTDSGMDAFISGGDRPYLWYILQKNKGLFFERLGRVGECLKLVQDVWEEMDRIDDIDVVLTFYWLRAEMSYRMQMDDDAIRYASEGLDIARRNLSYRSIITLCTVLGNVFMRKKDFEAAKNYFQTALDCPKTMISKSLTKTLISLGMLYNHQGNTTQALETFDQAIQNAKDHNDAPRIVNALLLIGDLHRKMDQTKEAIQVYEEALSIARDYVYKIREHRALYGLAESWRNIDEKEFQKYVRSMYEIQKHFEDKEDFLDELE
ncbi:tetratricopeptide repeat protein [Melghirimyces profundicolus]|uniref:Tetratricopeptide repeat protein n=1 Tax=Melghirimyces profundicolus TaxID=1242148 RepID=A0A2T6BU45_9BACL|nr:DUF2225 domain-containing protein [Melghirimyces profundicolus]PTX59582.1 tetratricopeptide repeat protein [Melghirimyces profundicolus]